MRKKYTSMNDESNWNACGLGQIWYIDEFIPMITMMTHDVPWYDIGISCDKMQ